jgi:hypothetical protein
MSAISASLREEKRERGGKMKKNERGWVSEKKKKTPPPPPKPLPSFSLFSPLAAHGDVLAHRHGQGARHQAGDAGQDDCAELVAVEREGQGRGG